MPLARRSLLLALVLVTGACSDGGGSDERGADIEPSSESTTTTAPTSSTVTTTEPPATTTTAPATTTTAPSPAEALSLRPGDECPEVLVMQQRLEALGYWLGTPDGRYGHLTAQAVMAFQKAEGLSRDGIAGPATLERLAVATRPVARDAARDGIEIDLDRQLLLVVAGGEVTWAFNTSTGTTGWATPTGEFTIDREIDGYRHAPLGTLYRPKYFEGGIAVHGSSSIPGYPASHGCARVSNAAMDLLWSSGSAALGTSMRVY